MQAIRAAVAGMIVVAAARAIGAPTTAIPDDLHLLVGKQVVVGRIPLCVANTYTPNLAYAGKAATVLAFTEGKSSGLIRSSINRMPPNMRPQMEDAAKGGILQFQFGDGTKLDTCVDQTWSAVAPNLELAAGETITLPTVPPAGEVTATGAAAGPQNCPVVITSASSGVTLLHDFVDALTMSELQRQLDQTMHGGRSKHYLDMRAQNASDRSIAAFEFAAIYSDKMGDATTSAIYVSQNSHPIKPAETYRASAMDRAESSQNGVGTVTLYISRVRFQDGTFWRDDGSRSCAHAATVH